MDWQRGFRPHGATGGTHNSPPSAHNGLRELQLSFFVFLKSTHAWKNHREARRRLRQAPELVFPRCNWTLPEKGGGHFQPVNFGTNPSVLLLEGQRWRGTSSSSIQSIQQRRGSTRRRLKFWKGPAWLQRNICGVMGGGDALNSDRSGAPSQGRASKYCQAEMEKTGIKSKNASTMFWFKALHVWVLRLYFILFCFFFFWALNEFSFGIGPVGEIEIVGSACVSVCARHCVDAQICLSKVSLFAIFFQLKCFSDFGTNISRYLGPPEAPLWRRQIKLNDNLIALINYF